MIQSTATMENSSSTFRGLLAISSFLIVCLILSPSTTAVKATANLRYDWNWISPTEQQAACKGSIGECMDDAAEFEMESESTRRILATTKYISYQALQPNTVPCSIRGASYSNCQTGAQANPYNRGCSAIAKCRS